MPRASNSLLADHIGYALRRAQLAVFQDFRDSTADFGLRPAEYSALVIVGEKPGTRHHELSNLLNIKPGNCVILIDKLEERGLVTRRKLKVSGRAITLSLTAKGTALLRQVNKKVDAHCKRMRDRIGEQELPRLLSLLSRLF